jgi:gliding motility-associated-like protein
MGLKKLYLLVIFFLSFVSISLAQRGKDGAGTVILNQYSKITQNAVAGNTSVMVESTMGLGSGDLVMIIQMQGATIKTGVNDVTWGEIQNYGNSGNYEFREVLSVSGTTLNLTCGLKHSYDFQASATGNGKTITSYAGTQVIKVPRYSTLNITGTVTPAQAWNGATGGVVVAEVLGDATINGSINATGAGFRGGMVDNSTSYSNVYNYGESNPSLGASKGESIAGSGNYAIGANLPPDYLYYAYGEYGMGAPANGGGGGSNHNGGGGGGANAGNVNNWIDGAGVPNTLYNPAWTLEAPKINGISRSGGGKGGYSYGLALLDPLSVPPGDPAWQGDKRRIAGGKGGRPLTIDPENKIFLGGGGGSGDSNDNCGSAGGSGGGLVYILSYGNISGSGSINANGNDGVPMPTIAQGCGSGNDAAPGAGGGGTIILNAVGSVSNALKINTNGGKGTNQDVEARKNGAQPGEAEGPGGGGGGGYIAISSGSPGMNMNGGLNGITDNSVFVKFPPNGATSGGVGASGNVKNFTYEATGTTICAGSKVTLNAIVRGNPPAGYTVNWYTSYSASTPVFVGNPFVTPALNTTTVYWVEICNGGTYRDSALITVNTCGLKLKIASNPSVICIGESTALTATVTSGTPPFSYAWSNGLPGVAGPIKVSPIADTKYVLKVTDSQGLRGTDSVTISVNKLPDFTINPSNVSCYGVCDGKARIVMKSNTPIIKYKWDAGANNQADSVATNLCSGTYSVIVTDSKICSNTGSVQISQPQILKLTAVTTNGSCQKCNGLASINATGGTGTYIYSWDANANSQIGATAVNLCAGNFKGTVKDANNCLVDTTVAIGNTTNPILSITHKDVTCNGAADGSIAVTASMGSLPYSFAWSNGSSIQNPSNLKGGKYKVILTDKFNCMASDSTVVLEPTVLVTTVSSYKLKCKGDSNGQLTATVSGGTFPYSFLWDDAQNTATALGLKAGTYVVNIKDTKGCMVKDSGKVTEVSSLSASVSNFNLLCHGDANGVLTATVNGGTPSYTYLWNNGKTNASISSLSAGLYSVTVADANKCKLVLNGIVSEPSKIKIAASVVDASCEKTNGSIALSGSGGSPPFQYGLSGTFGGSAQFINLSASNYTVSVVDKNKCQADSNLKINNSFLPILSIDSLKNVTCGGQYGCNGSVKLKTSKGTAPFTYKWSSQNNSNTSSASNLCAGNYTVTVSDKLLCTTSLNIPILMDTKPQLSVNVSDDLCGYGNGTAAVTVKNAFGKYKFSWSNGKDSSAIHTLKAGAYSVKVKDGKGCVDSTSFTINLKKGIVADFSYDPKVSDIDQPEKSFHDLSSQTKPIFWLWSFGDTTFSNIPDPSHFYNNMGIYNVKLLVKDQNNCVDSIVKPIEIKDIFSFYISNAFSPNHDGINEIYQPKGHYIDPNSYEFRIFDRWGTLVFYTNKLFEGWDGRYGNVLDGWNGRLDGKPDTEISQNDVYVYLINLREKGGKPHKYSGTVTLVK